MWGAEDNYVGSLNVVNIRGYYSNIMRARGVDWSGSGQWQVAGCFERGDELCNFSERGVFFEIKRELSETQEEPFFHGAI